MNKQRLAEAFAGLPWVRGRLSASAVFEPVIEIGVRLAHSVSGKKTNVAITRSSAPFRHLDRQIDETG